MSDLRLSVVVASAGRPRALARCLTGLSQMRSTRFEVVVVADPDGLAVARVLPFADRLKFVPQAGENISRARNDGVAVSAGEVIAFIDDDAVPEPTWAEHLLVGFDAADTVAVTGPVLGRNGISEQWGRMAVDTLGRDRWLAVGEAIEPGETLKLHGTNMAVRRNALRDLGGFDAAFAFYLDETDLALRLAKEEGSLRYLDGAVVHHGLAASVRRTEDRVPLTLHDIGASSAVFLRKHADPDQKAGALRQLEEDQRARLLRLARKRKLGPRDMRQLLRTLADGIAEGAARISAHPDPLLAPDDFLAMRVGPPPAMSILDGWLHLADSLRTRAAVQVAAGTPTTLIVLEPSPRKHKVEFTEGGWWEHRGGVYGPSKRSERRLQFWRRKDRVQAEINRISRVRSIV